LFIFKKEEEEKEKGFVRSFYFLLSIFNPFTYVPRTLKARTSRTFKTLIQQSKTVKSFKPSKESEDSQSMNGQKG
jgi:hypothetical protein